jgi:hypothetical protein
MRRGCYKMKKKQKKVKADEMLIKNLTLECTLGINLKKGRYINMKSALKKTYEKHNMLAVLRCKLIQSLLLSFQENFIMQFEISLKLCKISSVDFTSTELTSSSLESILAIHLTELINL